MGMGCGGRARGSVTAGRSGRGEWGGAELSRWGLGRRPPGMGMGFKRGGRPKHRCQVLPVARGLVVVHPVPPVSQQAVGPLLRSRSAP